MTPDDRRRAIVEAVRPLLIEHGDRLTTRLIAEAAGIAEGTIFRVFPDKAAILDAVAADTLDPPDARERLLGALEGTDDLDEKVRVVARLMMQRSEEVVAVMMSMRRHWAARAHAEHEKGGREHGPPAFMVHAHQSLLERLTEVFEPHAAELTVTPERAALLLRTLVLGSRNPGVRDADRLSAEEVADVLLHGIRSTHDHDSQGDPC